MHITLIHNVCECNRCQLSHTYLHTHTHTHTHTHLSYYDDFHTIDWVRDRSRDRVRHKRLNKNRKLSWKGWYQKFWDAGSGWMIVFLVGVSSGMLAGGMNLEQSLYSSSSIYLFRQCRHSLCVCVCMRETTHCFADTIYVYADTPHQASSVVA